MSEQELWHVIEEFPNYSVSNWGNVRNDVTGKLRTIGVTKKGYNSIAFRLPSNSKSRQKGFPVHRLVAKYFIDNPLNKPQVNHINGNKQNNHYENLEWVTPKENSRHSIDTLKKGIGETNSQTLISEFEVLVICDMIKTKSFKEVDRLIGHPNSAITANIAYGRNWKHVTDKLSHIPYTKTKRHNLNEFYVLILCEMYRRKIPRKEICASMDLNYAVVCGVLQGKTWTHITNRLDFMPFKH